MIRFTEEHRDLREMVADFSLGELAPHAEHTDETAEFPRARLDQMAELGLLGAPVPEAHGGGDGDLRLLTIVWEELARGCGSTATVVMAHTAATWVLAKHASESVQSSRLPGLASGACMATLALHETLGDGSDTSIATTAEAAGDEWLVSGEKCAVISSRVAGLFLVLARTPEGRVGLFAVDRNDDSQGVTVVESPGSLGCRGAQIESVIFDRARATALGDAHAVEDAVGAGHVGIAALLAGLARSAHDYSIQYASERKAFGRSIDRFEAIQLKLAESEAQLEACRLLAYRAAQERDDDQSLARPARIARLFAGNAVHRIAKEAVQVLGGNGYSREYPVERGYRDAMTLGVLDGAGDSHRLRLAEQLIGVDA